MNVELRQPLAAAKVKPAVIDCDIHPTATLADLRPYLSNRWWDYLQTTASAAGMVSPAAIPIRR